MHLELRFPLAVRCRKENFLPAAMIAFFFNFVASARKPGFQELLKVFLASRALAAIIYRCFYGDRKLSYAGPFLTQSLLTSLFCE